MIAVPELSSSRDWLLSRNLSVECEVSVASLGLGALPEHLVGSPFLPLRPFPKPSRGHLHAEQLEDLPSTLAEAIGKC